MNTMSLSNTRFAIIKSILIMLFIWCLITFQKKTLENEIILPFLNTFLLTFMKPFLPQSESEKRGNTTSIFFYSDVMKSQKDYNCTHM